MASYMWELEDQHLTLQIAFDPALEWLCSR
jgi:hypothetical protein